MLQQQGNNKPFIPEENAAAAAELAGGGGECQPDGRSEKAERELEAERGREVRLDFRSLLSVIFRGERRERLCEEGRVHI